MKRPMTLFAAGIVLLSSAPLASTFTADAATATPSVPHALLTCANSHRMCPEVRGADEKFGHYVGHDEPSILFYSNKPGSGNRLRYKGVIPSDPTAANPASKSYNFQLYAAFWFGMAMCDTQSYPLAIKTCTPNSDSNITALTNPNHAGTAYTELQFYPPGWVQEFDGLSCSAKQWCVSLTVTSLSFNNITGEPQNESCQQIASIEPQNFAYLTRSGKPQGPPDPVHFDPVKSGRPDPNKALFLNPGDHFSITMHDTAHGLYTEVDDLTTGQKGSMTASAANGYSQIKFAPKPSKECTAIPYDFHPMYSTSRFETQVPWTVHTYNVAIDTEIGHFQHCSKVPAPGASCAGTGEDGQRPDFDDNYCFGPAYSTLVKIGGCLDSNEGFDGSSYQPVWPNGDTKNRPGPTIFTSPRTGSSYDVPYSQIAFESDVPVLEDHEASPANNCDVNTGSGCTRVPLADYHGPAKFYPYYTTGSALGGCAWTIGQNVAGFSTNDYGKVGQYGPLVDTPYNDGGHGVVHAFLDFRKTLTNPCP